MSVDFKKPGLFTQFQLRASQFDLVIRVNLETTARLMFLSQFVPQIFLSVTAKETIGNFTVKYLKAKQLEFKNTKCMLGKNVIKVALSINIYKYFSTYKFSTLFLNIEKHMLTFSASGKEF